MDNQIIKIQGVRGYCDNCGTAWLNVEDVARGLGFVEAKKFSTRGENYVRWERVNGNLTVALFDCICHSAKKIRVNRRVRVDVQAGFAN